MRTLLRNATTGLYVQSDDNWTRRQEEAFDFKTMGHAIRFVEGKGLRKMELAFVSPRLSQFTTVPLDRLRWGISVSQCCAQAA